LPIESIHPSVQRGALLTRAIFKLIVREGWCC
jgi:hypothetical protein